MNTTILQPNTNNATDIRSALATSGLDWRVDTRSIFTANGVEVKGKYATVRTDKEGPDSVLGIVGSKYTIVQNADAFAILDDVITADPEHAAEFSSVGIQGNGRRVYATVDIGRPFDVVPGDTHTNYMLAITSHDGSCGTQLGIISFRKACWNATRRAIREMKTNKTLTSIPHTASSEYRLKLARKQFADASYSLRLYREQLQAMAQRQVGQAFVREILDRLIPKAKDEATESRIAEVEARRDKFMELFEANDGDNGFKLVRGTPYNVYNAYTEYVDHYEPVRSADKSATTLQRIRQERAYFGTGSDAKEKALELIYQASQLSSVSNAYVPAPTNAQVLDSILTN